MCSVGTGNEHEFRTIEEETLDALLHGAYPSALAKLRLMMEHDELHGVEIELEGGSGSVRIEGAKLRDKLDAELGRRWSKSARGQGGGT
jgi:hypothetical protein